MFGHTTPQSVLNKAGDFIKPQGRPPVLSKGIFSYLARRVGLFSSVSSKDCAFADVSFWDGVIDWGVMRQRAGAVIIRGGQNEWVDSMFHDNYNQAKGQGMKRGVYWFYDDRVSPERQAGILAELIEQDLPEMGAFVDWENGYGGHYSGLENVVRFMVEVERLLPSITRIGMYTGYYWFTENTDPVRNQLEYAYLRDKALWLAWYTNDVAVPIVPAPWEYATHWQWGTPDWGAFMGTQGSEVDMNYYMADLPAFESEYGEDWHDFPVDEAIVGMRHKSACRHWAVVNVLECDLAYVELIVTDHFADVLDAMQEYGAVGGENGDGWGLGAGSPSNPNSIAASFGRYTQPVQMGSRPWFHQAEDGTIEFDWRNPYGLYQAVSGDRYLVENGKINEALYSRLPEKNARVVVAETWDGKVLLFKNDGHDYHKPTNGQFPPQGLSWVPLAEVLISMNVKTAINLDGGGSAKMGIARSSYVEELGQATDDGIPGTRETVNHLLVKLKSGGPVIPPPGGSMNGTAKEKLGKTMSVRTGPSASNSTVYTIGSYEQFEFTGYEQDSDHPGDSEYSWLKLTDGMYTNHIYPPNGLRVDILQEPGVEPPPAGDEEMIQMKDGVEVRRWIPKQ